MLGRCAQRAATAARLIQCPTVPALQVRVLSSGLVDAHGMPLLSIDRSSLRQPRREAGPPVEKLPITPMVAHLKSMIEFRDRPLTMAEFMKEVLTHPTEGFYMTRDVFGAKGDFTTSPEISQMFGEAIGVWCVSVWLALGKPKRLVLAELGPGRGTLMADILRSTATMDGGAFAAALEVHMVEVSTPLRRMQWDNLRCEGAHPPPRVDNAAAVLPDGSFGDIRLGMLPGPGVGADADGDRDTQAGGIKDRQMAHDKVELTHTGVSQLNGRPVTWHRALSEVPRGPLVLLAHELFDALPVQQLKRTEHGWSERVVDIADQDSPEHLQLMMLKGPTMVSDMMVKARLEGMPQAEQEALQSVEVSSACWMLAQDIARRVADDEGAALVIDYGHEGPFGDSLQAIRQHEFVELLDDPGSADLSAYVDFGALRQAVHQAVADSTAQQLKGGLKDVPSVAQCYGPITQNQLLHAMGIHLRAQALAEGASKTRVAELQTEYNRLVGVGDYMDEHGNTYPGMGELYKAMAITSRGLGVPPGFDEASTEESDAGQGEAQNGGSTSR